MIVELYMNFGYDVGLGKDFGLTAWSEVGPVKLIHMGGLVSDHWDDYDLDESIEMPTDFTSYASRIDGDEDVIEQNAEDANTNENSEPTNTQEDEANTTGFTDEELAEALEEWATTQELVASSIWSCDY